MDTQTNAFKWPARGPASATKEFKARFAMRLGELMHARGLDGAAIAKRAGGGPQIYKWLRGEAAPMAKSAKRIASALDVTLEQLAGLAPIAGLTVQSTSNGNGAAHSVTAVSPPKRGKLAALPPPPRVPLPKSAPPPVVELKTYKSDPRFFVVTISGTFDTDTAMAMLALYRDMTGRE